jgi:c-di-GMP-binding flagellar brake protein YcgR
MNKQNSIEKRKFRRVLVVRPIKGHVKQNKINKEEDFGVHLMNISLSGAQIYSNQTLEMGDKVQLELPSLESSPTIIYLGKVVWVHKNPMKSMGRFAYGVHFEEVTPEKAKFLEQNFYLGEGSNV